MKYLPLFFLMFAILLSGCAVENTQKQELPRVNEYELGIASYEKGDYNRAAQYQTQWLTKYPKDAASYTERGRAQDKLNNSEAAIEDFDKAAGLAPNSLRPKVYLCGVLAGSGKTEEASEKIAELMSHPGFAKLGAYDRFLVYLLDGQLKNSSENFNGAIKSLNKSMEIFDKNKSAFARQGSPYINRLSYYQRAVANSGQGNYVDAAADMETYIALTEKSGQQASSKDYMSLAYALYMCEDYEKCKTVLSKVSAQDREQLAQTLGEGFFSQK